MHLLRRVAQRRRYADLYGRALAAERGGTAGGRRQQLSEAEAEELILRYFDQAQMTREFTELFGVTPRRFVRKPNPLLTLALESRQAKRLEALERVPPGGHRPWQ